MILAIVVAIAIPLVFLYFVRWLDLYASGSFRAVLVCLAWGSAAFVLVLYPNSLASQIIGVGLVVTWLAPALEEICKSLVLAYYIRRPDFTYFVDGAIYGFAAGTGFAVLENMMYLSGAGANAGLMIALSRAFSTSLMHGSATAIVGVTLGRFRYGRGAHRVAAVPLGWAAAMALHIIFNNVVHADAGTMTVIAAFVLGLGGVGLTALFIFWGLREEQGWLRESLKLDVGVSSGESRVVQSLDDLDRLLTELGDELTGYFGADKRKQVERFLKLQVQLGLKRKAAALTSDQQLRTALEEQVRALRIEIDELRRPLGVYCMAGLRILVPWEAVSLYESLRQNLASRGVREPTAGKSVWLSADKRIEARTAALKPPPPSDH